MNLLIHIGVIINSKSEKIEQPNDNRKKIKGEIANKTVVAKNRTTFEFDLIQNKKIGNPVTFETAHYYSVEDTESGNAEIEELDLWEENDIVKAQNIKNCKREAFVALQENARDIFF